MDLLYAWSLIAAVRCCCCRCRLVAEGDRCETVPTRRVSAKVRHLVAYQRCKGAEPAIVLCFRRSCRLEHDDFSRHSYCRGGCSFVEQCGPAIIPSLHLAVRKLWSLCNIGIVLLLFSLAVPAMRMVQTALDRPISALRLFLGLTLCCMWQPMPAGRIAVKGRSWYLPDTASNTLKQNGECKIAVLFLHSTERTKSTRFVQ